jgi:hypothetical protein
VIRSEGTDCVIKGQDEQEIQSHMAIMTLKSRNIEPGQRIEAKVNEQNKVMAILSDPAGGRSS